MPEGQLYDKEGSRSDQQSERVSIAVTLLHRHRSSQPPPTIDRETAATANAKDVFELALAIAEHANQRTENHEARITILESRLSLWMVWGTDIVHRWPIHRQSETAPQLPE